MVGFVMEGYIILLWTALTGAIHTSVKAIIERRRKGKAIHSVNKDERSNLGFSLGLAMGGHVIRVHIHRPALTCLQSNVLEHPCYIVFLKLCK